MADMRDKTGVLQSGRGLYMDLRKTYVPIGVVVALVGIYWWMLNEIETVRTEIRSEMREMIADSRSEISPTDAEVFLSKEAGRYMRETQEEIKRDIRALKENQEMLLRVVLEIKARMGEEGRQKAESRRQEERM